MDLGEKYQDFEDFLQEGLIGAILGVEDAEKRGIEDLGKHMGLCIKKQIWKSIKYWYNGQKVRHDSESMDKDINEESSMTLHDIISDKESTVENDVHRSGEKDDLIKFIDKLPEIERLVVKRHYLLGLSMDQIAKADGVTTSAILTRHRGAIKHLREAFNRNGYIAKGDTLCKLCGKNKVYRKVLGRYKVKSAARGKGPSNVCVRCYRESKGLKPKKKTPSK